MKKVIFLIVTLFLIVPHVSNISVRGEEIYDFTVDNLKYEIITESQNGNNGTVSVKGVNNNTKVVEVPPNVLYNSNIYTVTSIGDDAFNRQFLTSIKLPDFITSIGNNAFAYCWFKSIDLPDSITSIGKGAFEGCRSLTSIKLPNSITSIEDSTFEYCEKLESIKLPDSITSIGSYAFNQCRFLTSINLPDSLTSIGSRAFSGCHSLTSINLPDSITSIGVAVFWDCHGLTSIKLPNSITSIGDTFFANCEKLSSVNIPDSLTSIGVAAFSKCRKLTSIDLPDSLTSIGGQAFSDCSSLTSIDLPDSLTSIGGQAFSGCSSLTSIDLPDSLTSIGYASTFSGCSSLTSIELPDSITYISPTTFSGCSSLTNINLSDSITTIEFKAFTGCSSLASIKLPDSVTYIGYNIFDGCSSLTNIELPESLTSIGEYAFKKCDNLKTITIFADDFTKLDPNAFCYDDLGNINIDKFYVVNQTVKDKLIEICNIPESKIEIINSVLYNLTLNLNPDVAGEVRGSGSYREGRMVTITAIPQKDYKFDKWVVNSEDITLKDENSAQTTFKMPANDVNITAIFFDDRPFIEDSTNFQFNITKEATENSKGEASFTVKDKTITMAKLPNEVMDNKGNSYIISEVPDSAFFDCTSLEYIELPSTIASIGNNSFENCIKLTDIVIPESVTTLKSDIFSNCTELKNIIIKSENLTLNENTLSNLSADIKFYVMNKEIKDLLVQNNIDETQIITSKAEVKLQLEIINGLRVYNNNSNVSELINAISNLSNAILEFEQDKNN